MEDKRQAAVLAAYDQLRAQGVAQPVVLMYDVLAALYDIGREDALTELTPRLCSCMK